MTAYIKSDESFTAFIDGRVYTVYSTDDCWNMILDLARKGQWQLVKAEADRIERLRKFVHGKLDVRDGAVFYNGRLLDNALTKRILRMRAEGFSIDPLVKFVENLYQNPSAHSVEQLYQFLEANDQPITEDGCFMAYKRVRNDYLDVYSSSISNHVGAVVEMKRNQVNDDPEQTCSFGLHVASLPYLKHYSGERLMAVKVNPRDVVSVPTDYENSKMRVCRYEVVAELDMELVEQDRPAWDKTVVRTPIKKWRICTEMPDDSWMYWDGCGWTECSGDAELFDSYNDALDKRMTEHMDPVKIEIESVEVDDE